MLFAVIEIGPVPFVNPAWQNKPPLVSRRFPQLQILKKVQ